MKEVATVGVIKDDKLLMGKRRDNSRWTNPGGHLESGEDPAEGAARELYEEAGLKAKKLEHLRSEPVTTPTGKRLMIHAFKATIGDDTTSVKNDPDKEVNRWQWISFKKGLDGEIMKNLHSPKNVLLKALGLQKEGSDKSILRNFYEGLINAEKLTTGGVAREIGSTARKSVIPAAIGLGAWQETQRQQHQKEIKKLKKSIKTQTPKLDSFNLGFQKKAKEYIQGGLADGIKDSKFDPKQMAMGEKVEKEHTSNPAIAREISHDHLKEDPRYYSKLKKMESGSN